MTNAHPDVSPYIQIISGNQHNIFALDAKNRMLLVKKRLTDYTGMWFKWFKLLFKHKTLLEIDL